MKTVNVASPHPGHGVRKGGAHPLPLTAGCRSVNVPPLFALLTAGLLLFLSSRIAQRTTLVATTAIVVFMWGYTYA